MKFIIEDTDRKFTNITGFIDGTDYIAVDVEKDIVVSIDMNGNVISILKSYSLDDCIQYVREGSWKEIK